MPSARRPSRDRDRRSTNSIFVVGLARAVGGATIFALPIGMTNEMWTLGFAMSRGRLALFLVASVPLLVGLSAVAGFERTLRLKHDLLDAFVASAVGFATSALLLLLLGTIHSGQPASQLVGSVAVLAIPASIGALLAQGQFGKSEDDAAVRRRRAKAGYLGDLFLMAVGALFLGFSIAPTFEIVHIAARLDPWRAIALVVVSLAAMHAFVYAVEFSGQATVASHIPALSAFLRYTVAGYAVVLLICSYVLWTFGRTDGLGAAELVALVLTLGLPAAIGAAAARLIL